MKKSVLTTHKGINEHELVEIPPFDFEHSQPNKFFEQYDEHAETVVFTAEHEHIVVLEPDVAEYFPDSESVNTVLRAFISAISQIKNPKFSS
jgi:hypothetical protein